MPSRPSHRRLRTLFAGFLLVQVLHLGEHVVQMVQLHLLGWPAPTAKGVVSALDVEKVHAVWNVAVLLGLGWLLRRGAGSRWLIVAFGWAILHSAEHGYLLTRALLSGLEGQPGILGEGGLLATAGWTAAGFTTWSRPTVHFFWNLGEVALLALAYAAVVYPGWRVVPDIRWAAATAAALIGFVLLPDRGDVQPGLIRYVNATDPICGGHAPCHATIQAAVTAALSGETIIVQAGLYVGQVLVQGKNSDARAGEHSRIVIEGDPAAASGSVVLDGAVAGCTDGYAIRLQRSKFITIRGLTITGAGGSGDPAPGGKQSEPGHPPRAAPHLRQRLAPSATGESRSPAASPDTVIANSLIYGNGRHGIAIIDAEGGPHYIVGNTIHGNAWSGVGLRPQPTAFLVNNAITANGTAAGSTGGRFGVRREGAIVPHRAAPPVQQPGVRQPSGRDRRSRPGRLRRGQRHPDRSRGTGSRRPGRLRGRGERVREYRRRRWPPQYP